MKNRVVLGRESREDRRKYQAHSRKLAELRGMSFWVEGHNVPGTVKKSGTTATEQIALGYFRTQGYGRS